MADKRKTKDLVDLIEAADINDNYYIHFQELNNDIQLIRDKKCRV